ncbi:MAG: sugar phosphate isomerase/epimerase family protein [Pseudomonadota bacterium]
MRELALRRDLCSINTATLGYREPIAVTAARVAEAGFDWISPWRQEVDEAHPERAAAAIRAAGLKVASYCRSAYFTAEDEAGRRAAIDSNRRALEAAAVLGAPFLVAVVGGMVPGTRDIRGCRQQILDGLAALLPYMRETGVRIALEPLHPYYAAERSLLNTVDQALDWCDELDPAGAGWFGIAVDTYHVWWDPALYPALARGRGRIMAYHVSDWLHNTSDPLLDRGMMGDGVIDLPAIRGAVEATGYDGPVEVEIFSKHNWWNRAPDEILQACRQRFDNAC